jgi:hypothetical protein
VTAVPSYTISGIITLNGSGLAGINVHAAGTRWSWDAWTGPDGRYVISTLEDEYTVTTGQFGYTFSPATQSVSLHANASGVDFAAAVIPMYKISGTVTSNGNGLANISLTLNDALGNPVSRTWTDPIGSFNFENVLAGAYTITSQSCGYSIMPLPVTVSGADVMGLNLTAAIVPNYTVSGNVTSSGVGIRDIQVEVQTPGGGIEDMTMTGLNGSYSFTCLQPGTHIIVPTNWGTNYSFSPASAEVVLTESNPGATQDFTAMPL